MKVKEKVRRKLDIKEKMTETKGLGHNVHNQEANLKERGITLVALVVTIIILLILAGVAIATVTGDNGLFRKAREAVNTYKDAERNESQSLDYIAGQLGDLSKYDYNGYAKDTMEMTVSDGTYYLPVGFKLASDSGKTINEGIVVEDKNGNQWVWIPCYVDGGVGANVANAVKYDRYAFSRDDWAHKQTKLTKTDEEGNTVPDLDADGSQKIVKESNKSLYFHEALNTEDQASISKYGGYYIGRYEAGDKESSIAKEMRTSEKYSNSYKGNATHTVTIKKDQAPYNYVTHAQCVTLSNGIAKNNNYDTSKMYTKLCSSYAWDTALKFIGGDYATNSLQGNYKNTTFSYKDIAGVSQTKNNGDGILIPTGQTTAVKNIYDMGGNLWEYTLESWSNQGASYVNRGGDSGRSSDDYPVGIRDNNDGGAYGYDVFRPTLYLK